MQRVCAAFRSGVLGKLHVETNFPAASLHLIRTFAEGTYLSKDDVTQRILNVVKNFDKVDPGKVSLNLLISDLVHLYQIVVRAFGNMLSISLTLDKCELLIVWGIGSCKNVANVTYRIGSLDTISGLG